MLVINTLLSVSTFSRFFHGSEAKRIAGKQMGIMSADKVC